MALTAGSPEFKIGLIDGPSPSAAPISRESITSEVDHRAIMDIRCAAVPTQVSPPINQLTCGPCTQTCS
jgi:hypothetical protein